MWLLASIVHVRADQTSCALPRRHSPCFQVLVIDEISMISGEAVVSGAGLSVCAETCLTLRPVFVML